MRSELPLLFFVALAACTDKSTPGTDSGDTDTDTDTNTETGDSDTSEQIPVWQQIRIESSNTLTGMYPTGDGLAVVAEGGKAWLRVSGAWSSIAADTDNEDFNDVWGTGNSTTL